jgi:quercetin dioxygenase-like cupin family protein
MHSLPHPRTGVVRGPDAVPLMQHPLGALQLAGHADTGGAAAFVVHDLTPRSLGSPVHTHTREDEWSYVLSGAVGVQIGDETFTAAPGDLVLKPRNVPHAFWNPADEPARLLEVITPGGFENYFAELGAALAGGLDPARVVAIAERFGLVLDPGSIPQLARTHGLVLS